MMAETWTVQQMGSEGWAVFRPHPRRPSLDVMLCSGLTEADARMIASAPALQQRAETAERDATGLRAALDVHLRAELEDMKKRADRPPFSFEPSGIPTLADFRRLSVKVALAALARSTGG